MMGRNASVWGFCLIAGIGGCAVELEDGAALEEADEALDPASAEFDANGELEELEADEPVLAETNGLEGDDWVFDSEAPAENQCVEVRWRRNFVVWDAPVTRLIDVVEVEDADGDGDRDYPRTAGGFDVLASRVMCYGSTNPLATAPPMSLTSTATVENSREIADSNGTVTSAGSTHTVQASWQTTIGFPLGGGANFSSQSGGLVSNAMTVGAQSSSTQTLTDSATTTSSVESGTEFAFSVPGVPGCYQESVGRESIVRRFRYTYSVTQVERHMKATARCVYCAEQIIHVGAGRCSAPVIEEQFAHVHTLPNAVVEVESTQGVISSRQSILPHLHGLAPTAPRPRGR